MGTNVIYRANVNVENEPKTSAAFKRLHRKYMSLARAELVTVNADVTAVVSAVSGAATRMTAIREELRTLPDCDGTEPEQLQESADGLDFIEGEYKAALRTADELSECAKETSETREKFVTDLRNAVDHKVIDAGYLNEYTGAPGYNNMIADVRMLCRVYRNNSEALSGKTCRTVEEIDRAEDVIHHMEGLLGTKGLDAATVTKTAEMRTRAFTWVLKCYDKATRASNYIRWEQGDADTFTPSLYANRGGGKRKSQPEDAAQPQQPVQPAQPVIGANGPFVTTPATPATPATGTQVRIAGMPGGSPFMQ